MSVSHTEPMACLVGIHLKSEVYHIIYVCVYIKQLPLKSYIRIIYKTIVHMKYVIIISI